MLPVLWATCAVVIITCAVRARAHATALRRGRIGFAVLFVGAGAAVNASFLLRGDDYADFATGSYLPFVRDTWASLVVPNHDLFISALIAFELAVGLLALAGGRSTQVAYAAAIAFHVALLSFGWGFYVWSTPMVLALAALLRAERAAARAVEPREDQGPILGGGGPGSALRLGVQRPCPPGPLERTIEP